MAGWLAKQLSYTVSITQCCDANPVQICPIYGFESANLFDQKIKGAISSDGADPGPGGSI